MHAAINSHASVVKLLLRAGADKDATDEVTCKHDTHDTCIEIS